MSGPFQSLAASTVAPPNLNASRQQQVSLPVRFDDDTVRKATRSNRSQDSPYPGAASPQIQNIVVDDIVFKVLKPSGLAASGHLKGLGAMNGLVARVPPVAGAAAPWTEPQKRELLREAIKVQVQPIGVASQSYLPGESEQVIAAQFMGIRTIRVGCGQYGNDQPNRLAIHPGTKVRAYVPLYSPQYVNQRATRGGPPRVTLEAGPATSTGMAARLALYASLKARAPGGNDGFMRGFADADAMRTVLDSFVEFLKAFRVVPLTAAERVDMAAAGVISPGSAEQSALDFIDQSQDLGKLFAAICDFKALEDRFNIGVATVAADGPDKTVNVALNVGGV